MARTRTVPTYITNTHPTGRTCLLCKGPIINGQGAYVRQDGRGATHASPSDCTLPHPVG